VRGPRRRRQDAGYSEGHWDKNLWPGGHFPTRPRSMPLPLSNPWLCGAKMAFAVGQFACSANVRALQAETPQPYHWRLFYTHGGANPSGYTARKKPHQSVYRVIEKPDPEMNRLLIRRIQAELSGAASQPSTILRARHRCDFSRRCATRETWVYACR